MGVEGHTPEPSLRPRFVLSVAVGAAWLAGWIVRTHSASPNVDDFLYTILAHRLWVPLSRGHLIEAVHIFLTSGETAPLIPGLGAPLSGFGPDVVVLIQLPLLLTLSNLIFAIVERVQGTRVALVAALATALSPPVLNWSLMVHMALASAVCTLAALDVYLRSDAFARRGPTLWLGVSIGLLALSRSMAPVYVSAVCGAFLVSALLVHRGDILGKAGNVAFGAVAAAVIAGPWYWTSGLTALNYLIASGYLGRTGFIEIGNPLRVRFDATLRDIGAAQAGLLLLMGVLSIAGRLRERRTVPQPKIETDTQCVLFTFGALAMALLSTSGNPGTAFDLPVVVTLMPALVLCLPRGGAALKISAAASLLVSGLAIAQSCLAPGWEDRAFMAPAPEYAGGIALATGQADLQQSVLTDRIGALVGDHDLFVVRDDAVVNVNGLSYYKIRTGASGVVGWPSYAPEDRRVVVPEDYDFVLTGRSCAPYHRNVDSAYLESSLEVGGWLRIFSRRVC